MAVLSVGPAKLIFHLFLQSLPVKKKTSMKPVRCTPFQQVKQETVMVEETIMCDPCGGKGWTLCDFCKGKKTNVTTEKNRIYRRCPSCRAVGYVLCSKCKVFKCVTFPNYSDGEDLSF